MFKSSSFLKTVSLSLISVFIIVTTGCTYSPRKEEFLKTETYLTDKKIHEIELSAGVDEDNGKYLIVKPKKILKQDVMQRDIYNKWSRHTTDGNIIRGLFFPVFIPITILFGDIDQAYKRAYGYAGPWQGPKKDIRNKRKTGKTETSSSTNISNPVNFKSEKHQENIKVDKGQSKLFLPDFLIRAFNIRPKNDVRIDISLRESSYKEGSGEGKTTYRVTEPHMDAMQMVSSKWLKADQGNELPVVERYARKGNEQASYLAGITGYEQWAKAREKDPKVRDLTLQYLGKLRAVEDKFIDKYKFNQALGHLYYDKKDYSQAVSFLEKQNTFHSNKLLGLISLEQNQNVTAKDYFEKALGLDATESDKGIVRENMVKANLAIISKRDEGISADIRKDKYLRKLGHFIEEKRYKKTFLYFSLLDAMKKEITLPKTVTYFKGFVHYQLKDSKNALKYLNAYLQEAGKNGKYYDKALGMVIKIESGNS